MDTKRKSKCAYGRGNTESRPNARSRNWCFTLNNYTPEDIEYFKSLDCKYIFQEEVGEEKGTPHLQGTLMYKNPRTRTTMKNVHRACHWEATKSLRHSIMYCSKVETRSGELFSNFDHENYLDTDTQEKKSVSVFKMDFKKEGKKLAEDCNFKMVDFMMEIAGMMSDEEKKFHGLL